MPSCNTNNSSNLSGNLNIHNITNSGARLLMTVPLSGFSGGRLSEYQGDDGITYGDAIRYNSIAYHETRNPSGGKYIKARANKPENSEVVGIVESVNVAGDPLVGDDGYVTVVVAGQINLPSVRLMDAIWQDPIQGLSGAAGGNDVYFLSAATAGVLQNLAPTEPTNVIKPIYQVAPDSPWTGQVVNYIGYQAGGQIVAEDTQDAPAGTVREMIDDLGGIESREGWSKMGSQLNLDADLGDTYGYAYQTGGLGTISETVVRCYFKTGITSNEVNQIFKMRIDGKLVLTCRCIGVSVANKYADLQFQASEYNNLETYITEDNYFTTASGALLQLSNTSARYISFTLPKVSTNTSKKNITLVMNGNDVKKAISYMCYTPVDASIGDWSSARKVALSVSQELNIKKITVNDTLKVENATYQVTDLVKTVEELINQVNTLTQRTGGASNTFTSAYSSVK